MWQRFTERARRVVFFAQEEAGRLGENYVSTEHLLLGLVRENDSVAARILDRLGISLGRIRSEIERQVARGDGRLGQDMQLTPRAKRVIDLAYDEARQLNNNYIGTEHLLLGLIREGEGLAGRVLNKLGVDLERTRREVTLLQDSEPNQAAVKDKDKDNVLSDLVPQLSMSLDAITRSLPGKINLIPWSDEGQKSNVWFKFYPAVLKTIRFLWVNRALGKLQLPKVLPCVLSNKMFPKCLRISELSRLISQDLLPVPNTGVSLRNE